ncbi:MAG TPA: hypothetical protein VED40_12635, partial [Azospirillaceae bacterium]|nr:hypothetical protein [Azospirillaceae bacterium]
LSERAAALRPGLPALRPGTRRTRSPRPARRLAPDRRQLLHAALGERAEVAAAVAGQRARMAPARAMR